MTTVVEQIKVEIDGETITVDHLSDGTFRKPIYLTRSERKTVESQRFIGYGTALKPAWEAFVVGRKPFGVEDLRT